MPEHSLAARRRHESGRLENTAVVAMMVETEVADVVAVEIGAEEWAVARVMVVAADVVRVAEKIGVVGPVAQGAAVMVATSTGAIPPQR